MPSEHIYTISLDISAEAYQRMYSGEARNVLVQDTEGRRVQFPAQALRKFVTNQGVRGTFHIRVDADHRLIDIQRA